MTVLHREFADFVIRSDGDGREVHGVVVPYNQTATIREAGGSYDERFVFGAFARSIEQRGHKVKLLVNHDSHGRLPIGRAIALRETQAGLEGSFHVSDTRDGNEALALVKDGVVDSFSIGFAPIRERRGDDGAVERIEATLHEVSLVGFPAYAGALVAGVRAGDSPVDPDERRARLVATLKRFQ